MELQSVCGFIFDTVVPPGPPIARVVGTTDHSIDVEWDPPADNGGGEILGYHVDKVRSSSLLYSYLFSASCLVAAACSYL